MRPWLVVLNLAAAGWMLAAAGRTVDDVVALVRSAIAHRQADAQAAKALHKIDLTERLDDRVVEELESAGAEPLTVAELERLAAVSAHWKKPARPPQFDAPPIPPQAEQNSIIEEARGIALNYAKGLPDFICTEMVRRYQDATGKDAWKRQDVLTVSLTYFKQREDYKLTMIDGRPTDKRYDSLTGAISQGEFGSMLLEVFHPSSKADFVWDHWTNLRKRPAHVYFYRVMLLDSHYALDFKTDAGEAQTVAGEHGFVYVDRDTHQVVRITRVAESLPRDFPIQEASASVDYGFAEVGGRTYLLPLRGVSQARHVKLQTRNDVAFSAYRKFGAEANISFD